MKNTSNKTKNRFFAGVAALALGNIFVKIVGLVLKIPLHDMLGDAGMAYYNNSYDIYAWLFSISTIGLPTAIAIMISENRAKKNYAENQKILRMTVTLFLAIGIIGSSIMYFGASVFEQIYNIENSSFCIKAVAPTLFFICVASALRGYFQGYQNMIPTAVSEIIEAVGKFALGLLFASFALQRGEPIHIVASYAALGLTVGVAAGMLYLIISKLIFRPMIYDTGTELSDCEDTEIRSTKKLLSTLLMIAVPITISSSVASFSALIDGILITRRLFDAGFDQETVKTFTGNYKTLCSPLCNLAPALITPVTAAIVPLISNYLGAGRREKAAYTMNGGLLITAIIELPCSIGLSVLSLPVLKLLFGDTESSKMAAPLLSILSTAVFFVSIISVTSGFLQSYKLERKPIYSMLIGAAVKIVTIYILVGDPNINIYGAPISSLLGGIAISAANLYFMRKHIGFVPDYKKMLVRPLVASVICGLAALGVYYVCFSYLGNNVSVLISIVSAAVVYFFSIFLLKAVGKDDVLLLPKGEKICRLLEKMKLLKA